MTDLREPDGPAPDWADHEPPKTDFLLTIASDPARQCARQRETEGGTVLCAAAHPDLCPFLTLAEQLESVMRARGLWAPDGKGLVKRVLTDLSDPSKRGAPELVRLGDCRAGKGALPVHVLWRVGLARAVIAHPVGSAPLAPVDPTDERPRLFVALRAGTVDEGDRTDLPVRTTWPKWLLEHVGRYLHAWSRAHGRVHLFADWSGFKAFADRSVPPKLPAVPAPPVPVPAPAVRV